MKPPLLKPTSQLRIGLALTFLFLGALFAVNHFGKELLASVSVEALNQLFPVKPNIKRPAKSGTEVWFTVFLQSEDELLNLTLTRDIGSGTWQMNGAIQLFQINFERYLSGAVNFKQRYFVLKITDQKNHNLTIVADALSSNFYLKLKSIETSVELHYLPNQLNTTWCFNEAQKLILNVNLGQSFLLQFYNYTESTTQMSPLLEMSAFMVNDNHDESKRHLVLSSRFNNTQLLNGSIELADGIYYGQVQVLQDYTIKVIGNSNVDEEKVTELKLNLTISELTANSIQQRQLYTVQIDSITDQTPVFVRAFDINLKETVTQATTNFHIGRAPTPVDFIKNLPSFFSDDQMRHFIWPPSIYYTEFGIGQNDSIIWFAQLVTALYTGLNSTVSNGAQYWLNWATEKPDIVPLLQTAYLMNGHFLKHQMETINHTAKRNTTFYTFTTNTTNDNELGFKSSIDLYYSKFNRTNRSVVLQMWPNALEHTTLSIDMHPKKDYKLDFEWIASRKNTATMLDFTVKTIDPEILHSNVIAHLDSASTALYWRMLNRFDTPVNGSLSLTFLDTDHWFVLFDQTENFNYTVNGSYDSMTNDIKALYNFSLPGTIYFDTKMARLITEKSCIIGKVGDKSSLFTGDPEILSYRMDTCPVSDTAIRIIVTSSPKQLFDGTVQLAGERLQDLSLSGQFAKEEKVPSWEEEEEGWFTFDRINRLFWGSEYKVIAEINDKLDTIYRILLGSVYDINRHLPSEDDLLPYAEQLLAQIDEKTLDELAEVLNSLNLDLTLPDIDWIWPNSTVWNQLFSKGLQKVVIHLSQKSQQVLDPLVKFTSQPNNPLSGVFQHVKSIAERFYSNKLTFCANWDTFLEHLTSSSFFPPSAVHYTFNQTDNSFLLNITRHIGKD